MNPFACLLQNTEVMIRSIFQESEFFVGRSSKAHVEFWNALWASVKLRYQLTHIAPYISRS